MTHLTYTRGYTGRRSEEIERMVRDTGAPMVDIRCSPRSWAPQWSGAALARQRGEDYLHLPVWATGMTRTAGRSSWLIPRLSCNSIPTSGIRMWCDESHRMSATTTSRVRRHSKDARGTTHNCGAACGTVTETPTRATLWALDATYGLLPIVLGGAALSRVRYGGRTLRTVSLRCIQ